MVRYCNNLSFNLLFLVCCVVFLLYILCCLCVCVYNNFKISFVVDKGLFPLKTSIPHPKPKTRRLQQRRVSQSTKRKTYPRTRLYILLQQQPSINPTTHRIQSYTIPTFNFSIQNIDSKTRVKESKRKSQKHKVMPDNYSSRIEYSEKYSDDKYEYRYVRCDFMFDFFSSFFFDECFLDRSGEDSRAHSHRYTSPQYDSHIYNNNNKKKIILPLKIIL